MLRNTRKLLVTKFIKLLIDGLLKYSGSLEFLYFLSFETQLPLRQMKVRCNRCSRYPCVKESLKSLIIRKSKNGSLLIKLMKLLLTSLLIVPAAIDVIPCLFPRDPLADSRKDVRLDTEERVAVKSFYMHFNFFSRIYNVTLT